MIHRRTFLIGPGGVYLFPFGKDFVNFEFKSESGLSCAVLGGENYKIDGVRFGERGNAFYFVGDRNVTGEICLDPPREVVGMNHEDHRLEAGKSLFFGEEQYEIHKIKTDSTGFPLTAITEDRIQLPNDLAWGNVWRVGKGVMERVNYRNFYQPFRS
jgi:hypothetical protein